MAETQRTEVSGWTLEVTRSWASTTQPEPSAEHEASHAVMTDLLPLGPDDDGVLRVAVVAPGEQAPSLVARLGYDAGGGFGADALLVPETSRVFLGGGTRMICYAHAEGRWRRQWEREVEVGFRGLARHGGTVVMSAELELAAWSLDGERPWSAWVEPPWGYEVDGDRLRLDVMGKRSVLDLNSGSVVADQDGAARRFVTRLGGLRSRD